MSNDATQVVQPRAEQIAQVVAATQDQIIGTQGGAGVPAPGVSPAAAAPPAAAPGAPAAVPLAGAGAPAEPIDAAYVQRLRDEAAQARAQQFGGLTGTNRVAIEQFVRAVAEGDDDVMDAWLMNVAQHRGLLDEAAPAPPQQQQQPGYGQAPSPSPSQPLTAEDVQRLIAENGARMQQEWADQQRAATARANVDAVFQNMGLDPTSPIADSVRALGARMSQERGMFVPPAEVYEAWKAQVAPLLGVTAPGPAPATTPAPPVVGGIPSAVDPQLGMTPEQKATARLEAAKAARLGVG